MSHLIGEGTCSYPVECAHLTRGEGAKDGAFTRGAAHLTRVRSCRAHTSPLVRLECTRVINARACLHEHICAPAAERRARATRWQMLAQVGKRVE